MVQNSSLDLVLHKVMLLFERLYFALVLYECSKVDLQGVIVPTIGCVCELISDDLQKGENKIATFQHICFLSRDM